MKPSKKTPAKKMIKKVAEKKPERKVVKKPEVKAAPAPVMPAAPKAPAFKIQPLADRVIIKEDTESKEQTTASGIIIPVSAQEDKGSKRGVVVAVGNGRMEEGKVVPLAVSTGDKVLFQWGDKVRVDNEDFYIVRESEILAIIN